MCGFVKLHRSLLNWEWYNDIPTTRLFTHLLLSANFKDKKWKGILIKRGQLLTGRIELSKETGLSQQQVRTALTKLKSTNELTIISTNKYSILEIVNYSLYQDKETNSNHQINQQPTKPATSNQPAINQQSTTTKEGKKVRRKEGKNKYPFVTEGLKFVLERKMNKSFSDRVINNWGNDIRKLIDIDLEKRPNAIEDVTKAIQSINDNWEDKYFPIIQSGSSLREKFSKIEAHKVRVVESQQSKYGIKW